MKKTSRSSSTWYMIWGILLVRTIIDGSRSSWWQAVSGGWSGTSTCTSSNTTRDSMIWILPRKKQTMLHPFWWPFPIMNQDGRYQFLVVFLACWFMHHHTCCPLLLWRTTSEGAGGGWWWWWWWWWGGGWCLGLSSWTRGGLCWQRDSRATRRITWTRRRRMTPLLLVGYL